MRAKFEQQVQGLETEKAKVERDFKNLQVELVTTQSSLVSPIMLDETVVH